MGNLQDVVPSPGYSSRRHPPVRCATTGPRPDNPRAPAAPPASGRCTPPPLAKCPGQPVPGGRLRSVVPDLTPSKSKRVRSGTPPLHSTTQSQSQDQKRRGNPGTPRAPKITARFQGPPAPPPDLPKTNAGTASHRQARKQRAARRQPFTSGRTEPGRIPRHHPARPGQQRHAGIDTTPYSRIVAATIRRANGAGGWGLGQAGRVACREACGLRQATGAPCRVVSPAA